jgi:hypothetical protein
MAFLDKTGLSGHILGDDGRDMQTLDGEGGGNDIMEAEEDAETTIDINSPAGAKALHVVDYTDFLRHRKIVIDAGTHREEVNDVAGFRPPYLVLSWPLVWPHKEGAVVTMPKDKDETVYRPWKTRFDLQPFDLNSGKFMKPENRLGYRRFYAANPHLALAPNSRDRDAQSTVVMIFGLTALGAIIGGILIVEQSQVLGADELNLVNYQRKMIRVVVLASLPWLFLGGWLLSIFVAFAAHPMRYPSDTEHWQCGAMLGFLLIAPLVNLLYFTAHALWISKLSFSVEKQAPMGRMFSLSNDVSEEADNNADSLLFGCASNALIRHILLCLEVGAAIFGYLLVTFRWGANSQYCQPEVYWATTALMVTSGIILVFTALAFICSVLVRAFSISPWMEDFVGSFWEFRDKEEAVENEEVEVSGDLPWEEEWVDAYDLSEERDKYEETLEIHEEYRQEVSESPPAREQTSLVPVHEEDDADDPLIIWGDASATGDASDRGDINDFGEFGGQGPSASIEQFTNGELVGQTPDGQWREIERVGEPETIDGVAVEKVFTRVYTLPPNTWMPPTLPPGGSLPGTMTMAPEEVEAIPTVSQVASAMFVPNSSQQRMPMPSSSVLPAGYVPGSVSMPGSLMQLPGTLPPSSFQQPPMLPGSMMPSGYIAGPQSLPNTPFASGPMAPGLGLPGTMPPASIMTRPPP